MELVSFIEKYNLTLAIFNRARQHVGGDHMRCLISTISHQGPREHKLIFNMGMNNWTSTYSHQ